MWSHLQLFAVFNVAVHQMQPSLAQATCSGSFAAVSASSFVANISPGWNLGNSLDAFPNEDSWNNAVVDSGTLDDVQAAGFKTVRVPVTWAYHFIGTSNQGDSPDWIVDPEWLQRVSDVIDMVTDRGLYAILNVHHDSALWANIAVDGANITMIEEKFYRLWYQIGVKFRCKPSTVAFEPLNEPPATTADQVAELNKLNNIFLQAINDAGGFNPQRVVTLVGPGEDMIATSLYFKAPDSAFSNPYAIQVHYYAPYAFTSAAWGLTVWGSDPDRANLETDFSLLRANFTDIPIVIGEWLVSPVLSEPAARWRYYDYFSQMAIKYGFATIIWDTGNDHLDRPAHTWHDITAISIHKNALLGINNSLPGSTTNAAASTQFTSAFVFQKLGDVIEDYRLPFEFNNNIVTSVTDSSSTLQQGTHYYLDNDSIILSASYLSGYYSSQSTGILGTVSILFSAGTIIPVQIVQWDTPLAINISGQAVSGSDTSISIEWKGIGKPATVAAYKADGSYLVDDWTVYLPPLQQGRTTFGAQWTWTWNQAGMTISSSAVSAVIAGGQSTTFVIEAYPRVPGNNANFTLVL